MLVAAAFMGMSVYKTATLDEVAASHFVGALEAQGIHGDAAAVARALLIDALGPMGGQNARGHNCVNFEINVERPDRAECRWFHLTVGGLVDAMVEGKLCPKPDGDWTEAEGAGMVASMARDQRWRDMILRNGATLYRDPLLASTQSKFNRSDNRVQVGGYSYHQAQTFGFVRLANGDSYYVLKDDLTPTQTR